MTVGGTDEPSHNIRQDLLKFICGENTYKQPLRFRYADISSCCENMEKSVLKGVKVGGAGVYQVTENRGLMKNLVYPALL